MIPHIEGIIKQLELGTLHAFKPEDIDIPAIQNSFITLKSLTENALKDAEMPKEDKPGRLFDLLSAYLPLYRIRYWMMAEKIDKRRMRFIVGDSLTEQLKYLNELYDNWSKFHKNVGSLYKKYESNLRLIMIQGLSPDVGEGNCHGLSLNYGNWRRNPDAEKAQFPYSSSISRHQAFQCEPSHPSRVYYHQRLTFTWYLPVIKDQVDFLVNQASKHPDDDLLIGFKAKNGRHACYLSVSHEKKWHFMEPNLGAFEFDSADEFKKFYMDYYRAPGNNYHSITISKIITEKPQTSLLGSLRGIISGRKYAGSTILSDTLIVRYFSYLSPLIANNAHYAVKLYLLFAGSLGVAITAVISFSLLVAAGLIPPVIPVAVVFVGGLIASALIATAGFKLTQKLYNKCTQYGFDGIFAPLFFAHFKSVELMVKFASFVIRMFKHNKIHEKPTETQPQDTPDSMQKIVKSLFVASVKAETALVKPEASGERSGRFFSNENHNVDSAPRASGCVTVKPT